ncbi:bola-like protein [Mytilinidion resinicola]|uniref:Bola-like protein n=1 Tax=Mytilinidion resinicola TaxID=574789 RepID=A0A6A6Y563_9PEZI|nr:bola-like protein [Mytilinidion resinicola]KAF2803663.1 bola-like protein [Mytilinidion resinicola]
MAPSRALQRSAASLLRTNRAPRLLAACRTRAAQPSQASPLLAVRPPPLASAHSAASRRPYSQEAASSSSSAVEPPDYLSEGELAVFNKIKAEFDPVNLEVQDISGGCGSMYALDIESARFKGLTVIKQHKLVNQVLADEIKSWHGVQLKTRPTS